ncbi:uncharacterized protein JCM10292_002827 [Rhodotorula paludigena]|uniref:uncharacterized protein n=1 Tax=Rhodotorula paludigena TaxID=86838 RepID=UPI00316C07FF
MDADPLGSRLVRDFAPSLDPALVCAILSDYHAPLSTADERDARATLDQLALDAHLDDDPPSAPLPPAIDRTDAPTDAPLERTDLLALISHASAQLDGPARPASGPTRARPHAASASVSDLGSALEHSSLDDVASGSASASASASGSGGGHSATGGARFWEGSAASSRTTSDEGGDSLGGGQSAGTLVWDAPADPARDGFDPADFEVHDDPLAFLASVFPHIDLAQLEAKILEVVPSAAPPGEARPADLERLIEDLLSQDAITALTEADAEAAAAANAPPPDPDGVAALSKQQRRRVKSQHKAAQSFSLTSTPHLSYASAAAAGSPARGAALADAPLSSNAWAGISSQATFLAACMHVPTARITSTYHAQTSSLARTVAVLLSQLAHDRPFESLPAHAELKSQLRLLVPVQKASDDELETLLSATEGDLSDALDLHAFISDLERTSTGGKALTLSQLVARVPNDPSGSALHRAAAHPPDGGFTVVSSSSVRRSPSLSRAQLPSSDASARGAPHERYTLAQCHALAADYLARRNDAFRTAARSFQRGGVGERGAAGYWAEKGREYDRERRKWDDRAARVAVGERRAKHDPNTVDLHGLTLAQALSIVDEAVNSWWTAARDTEYPVPLRIVTGVGRHSRNNTPILAPAVAKHLDREGWRWKWDDGPLVAGGIGAVSSRGAVRVLGVKR